MGPDEHQICKHRTYYKEVQMGTLHCFSLLVSLLSNLNNEKMCVLETKVYFVKCILFDNSSKFATINFTKSILNFNAAI